MKKVLKLLIAGLLYMIMLPVQAQDTLVLSLDSAVSYALQHNKTLVNSKYAIDKTQQQYKETVAKGLPQVDASMDYNNFLGATASLEINPHAPPAVIEFNPTSSLKAGVNQLLFSGNYWVGLKLAKLAKKMSEEKYQKDELDVKEQTIQSYFTILASKQILQTLRENKKNAEIIYNQTENMAKAGLIEQTDAEKLSVMVTSVDNAVKSAERNLELAYNLVRFNLGLPGNQPLKLSDNLAKVEARLNIDLSSPFKIQNNVDYRLLSIQGEMAKKNIDMAKSNYLPTLVGFYSYTKKLIKPKFDMSPEHILGVKLSVPIFSSGDRKAKLNQAKIDLNINENTKALLTDRLTLQEKQLRYNYNNLVEQYLSQKENVKIAKNVLDQMNLKFQQGLVSSLDLTSANNDYLKAEIDFVTTKMKQLQAQLALRKLNNNL